MSVRLRVERPGQLLLEHMTIRCSQKLLGTFQNADPVELVGLRSFLGDLRPWSCSLLGKPVDGRADILHAGG